MKKAFSKLSVVKKYHLLIRGGYQLVQNAENANQFYSK